MKIIWTDFAIENLSEIFNYYSENAHKRVAHKIKNKILSATKQLKTNPESGQIESNLEKLNQNHRYLVVENYKLIYRIIENQIIVNDVFDTRQNPVKMNDEKRKSK